MGSEKSVSGLVGRFSLMGGDWLRFEMGWGIGVEVIGCRMFVR